MQVELEENVFQSRTVTGQQKMTISNHETLKEEVSLQKIKLYTAKVTGLKGKKKNVTKIMLFFRL